MILRSTFLALLLCGLSPQHLSAQEPTAVMSLNDCMVYAVDHSYETQRAQNSLDNNKLDYTGAILDHLPSLSASVSGTTSFGRGIDPATNSYVNTSTFSNGLSSSASVPVFYGMRLLNSTRYYKISRLKGEESLKQQQDLTAQQVMVAYAEVVYNQELVALYQDQLESYEQSEKLAARKYELGNGSPTDLYEIQASVCSQQYNVITAQNNLEQSIIKLKDLMNFPLSDSLLIEPKIPETMLFDQDQELKAITAYAQANNSSAIISEYALTQSKLTLSIAKASFYPSVSLWANIYTSYYTNLDDRDITITPYADQLSDNMGKGVGASISIPIFSGLDTRLNVQKQRNNL
ncbi:MAG: TolC family protein, partial [Rikenellaceae bacterium]